MCTSCCSLSQDTASLLLTQGCECAQVFIAIAVFMGDGIYNLLKTIYLSVEVRILSGHSFFYSCSKSLQSLRHLHASASCHLCHTTAVRLCFLHGKDVHQYL